jgi:gliding motility-associated-like protein
LAEILNETLNYMKSILTVALISTIFLFTNCHKSNDTVSHVNCNGLITDTLGTGDNAKIYMPNAFTPNGDGRNDIIRPILLNITAFTFTIFDGNNSTVFTSSTPLQGWSTTVNANSFEIYYYKIQATTNNSQQIGMCGELYKLSCRPSNSPTLYFEDQLTAVGFTGTTGEILATCP